MRNVSVLMLALALFGASCLPALALELSTSEARAVAAEDWQEAINSAERGSELYDYAMLQWLMDSGNQPSFTELTSFIRTHGDWPSLNTLRMRVEKLLFRSRDTSADARDWLAQYEPISGYGMLAQARIIGGHERIRKAWVQGDFERGDEAQILQEFSSSLDASTHQRRAERLLASGYASNAERVIKYIPKDAAKLAAARIALQRKERNLDGKISAVPSALADAHGLLADRARWRHRKGLIAGARELLLQMRDDSPYADALWRIRASYARDAIEAKHYTQALALLASAGDQLNAGNQADRLWLEGWVQLRFKRAPSAAHGLFQRLYHSVKYPVSKARGAYWSAKAAAAQGNADKARAWLRKAAAHPTTFYGQLAYAQLAPNQPLKLPEAPSASSSTKARYAEHPLMKLAIAFYHADLGDAARPLLYHVASNAQNADEFAALMAVAREAKLTNAQVLVAKLALRKHVILPDGWPIITPPKNAELPPELALAISRQESEFNPRAVSRANARGLMQLLPSTARKVASTIGEPYSLDKLFDPVFNMRLGSRYLADLISGFDGNYILAIAGYNAGPGRSRQWVERFGWPGDELEQTLTFMELIPFSETRNYVQRVLENTQMYRARLNPNAPLMIEQDLLR